MSKYLWTTAALVLVAAIMILPIWGTAFTCDDDLFAATAWQRWGGGAHGWPAILRASWTMATGQGRFYQLIAYTLTQLPYSFRSFEEANVIRIACMFLVMTTFVLMTWELIGDYALAVYFSVLAIALLETKGPYTPFHGYPLWFNLGAAFLFLSLFLFHKGLRRYSPKLQWAAAGTYFCSLLFYETFLFYMPIFVFVTWLRAGDEPTSSFTTNIRMVLTKMWRIAVTVLAYVTLYFLFSRAHPSGYSGMALSRASAGSIVLTIIRFSVSGLNFKSALHFKSEGSLDAVAAAGVVFVISVWVIQRFHRALSKRQLLAVIGLTVLAMPLPNIMYGFIEKYRNWARTSNPSDAFYLGSFYSAFPFAIAIGCFALLMVQFAARLRLVAATTITISVALAWITFTNVVDADRFYRLHRDNKKLWDLVDKSLLTTGAAYGSSSLLVAPSLLRMPLLEPYIYDYWSFYYRNRLGRGVRVIGSPNEVATLSAEAVSGPALAFVPRYYPALRAGFYALGPIDLGKWQKHPTDFIANHFSFGFIGESSGLCLSLASSQGGKILAEGANQSGDFSSQQPVDLSALVFGPCASGSGQVNAKSQGGLPARQLTVVPQALKTPSTITVNQAAIDIVNDTRRDPGTNDYVFHAKTDGPLWIRGWAYDDTHKTVPSTVWLEFSNSQSSQRVFIPADRMDRPDVAIGFKLPWARKSGFLTQVITGHDIPRGTYDVKVYQVQRGIAELTRYYPAPTVTVIFE